MLEFSLNPDLSAFKFQFLSLMKHLPMLVGATVVIIVVQLLSHIQLFAPSWTAAHQASLILHYLPELFQAHVHWVGDTI